MSRWETKWIPDHKEIPPGWEPFAHTGANTLVRRRKRWWHRPLQATAGTPQAPQRPCAVFPQKEHRP